MRYIVILTLVFFLNSCVTLGKTKSSQNSNMGSINGEPSYAVQGENVRNKHLKPALVNYYAKAPAAEGSLWTENNVDFFTDRKAKKIGDSIVVDIVEKSSSSLGANTNAEKTTNMDIGVPKFFGLMRGLESKNSNLTLRGNGKVGTSLVGSNYKNEFDGKGSINRNGAISASIGAIVKEVLPNGNLLIYGKRELKVNNETQYIMISGTIRSKDISEDNRIKSTYIANAKIEYSGKGILANKQKPGWLSGFIDKIWPF